jgi:nucleotide-binding universal stress UspA family protein
MASFSFWSSGMTPIARILVPVDLSARSLEAAAYAVSLASEFGAELVFVHAL